jgi:phenylacetate-CoA ligase
MRLGVLQERRIGCDVPHAQQLQVLMELRAQVIQGYPSALVSLAAFIREQGSEIPQPRLVFTDSELLAAHDRRLIEETFRAPVIDVFGSWETGNIAHECEHRRGYHAAIDCVILEVIRENGAPARAGEEGEMVCTVLDNLAMPLIRYNLHDLAAWAPKGCSCGRTLPLLEMIGGRSDDRVRLADGRTQSPQGFLSPLKFASEFVNEFQVVQEAVDRFRIIVVPGPRFDDAARERIRSTVSSRYPSAEVSVIVVDHLQRERSGKRRSFRSEVPQ